MSLDPAVADPWDAPVDVTTAMRLTQAGITVGRLVGAQEYVVRHMETGVTARVSRQAAAEADDVVPLFTDAITWPDDAPFE